MIDSLLERAQQLIQLQRYKEAEKELRSILSQDPTHTHALALISICLAEQGKLDDAIKAIQSALSKEPDNDYLLYLQGLFHFKADKIKEAEKFVLNAIAFDPRNASYFGLMAAIRMHQKNWQEALENADKGLAIDPENLQCLNVRSTALYKLDRKEEAYGAIQEALNKDPENEYTHANLGWSLLEKGDHKKALEHFREALKINPGYAYAKAGMVEGLKARYLFYRLFLKYAFWISNFKGKAQWAILLGLYFGVKFLGKIADSNPGLAVILNPIVYLYLAFAVSTWVITPLSNLFLRLNVYGRYALTKEETRASNFVGIALLVGLAGFGIYLFKDELLYVLVGVYGISMMIPLSSMFNPEKKRNQTILMGYAIALGVIGILAIAQCAATGEVGILFPVYTFGVLAYQWVANAFVIRM
jgi:tetratricopeptide (TPR) repeat protein